jgi:lipopolysaccharide/colanic/teichoic acid biosynthesis glycosyltransferase
MKRLLDILLSSMALIILSPLLIPVAIILRCTGEGYIFYCQERVGQGGRVFRLYKFATMLKDSPNLPGGLFTKKNDPRVFPVGRLLRAAKINEIPQLLNVLLGDMSFIGPRPQVQAHFDMFPAHVRREIIKVRPGLSGIGSIVFRDEEVILAENGRGEEQFYAEDIAPYKGELEIWYVQHQSMRLDLLLMVLTVWALVFPRSTWYVKLLKDLPRPGSAELASALSLTPKDMILAAHEKYQFGSQPQWEQRIFEHAQLSLRSVRSPQEWWTAICETAELMDLAWVSIKTRHKDGRIDEEIWRAPRSEPNSSRITTVTVPLGETEKGDAQELELAVSADGSLEDANHRATLFGQFIDEQGVPAGWEGYALK